jgi:hypothetical protein
MHREFLLLDLLTIFTSTDSYGTFDLNGRAEMLLGVFERRYQEELDVSADDKTNNNWWEFGTSKNNRLAKNEQNKQQVATKLAPYPWRVTRVGGRAIALVDFELSAVSGVSPLGRNRRRLRQGPM